MRGSPLAWCPPTGHCQDDDARWEQNERLTEVARLTRIAGGGVDPKGCMFMGLTH